MDWVLSCAKRFNKFTFAIGASNKIILSLQKPQETTSNTCNRNFFSSSAYDSSKIHHCEKESTKDTFEVSGDVKDYVKSRKYTAPSTSKNDDKFVNLSFSENSSKHARDLKKPSSESIAQNFYSKLVTKLSSLIKKPLPYDHIQNELCYLLTEFERLQSSFGAVSDKVTSNFDVVIQCLPSYPECIWYIKPHFDSINARIPLETFMCLFLIPICYLKLGELKRASCFIDKYNFIEPKLVVDFVLNEYLHCEVQHELEVLTRFLKKRSVVDINKEIDNYEVITSCYYLENYAIHDICEEDYFMPLTVGGFSTVLENIAGLFDIGIAKYGYLPSASITAKFYIYLSMIQLILAKMENVSQAELNQVNQYCEHIENKLINTIFNSINDLSYFTVSTIFFVLCSKQRMEKITDLGRLVLVKADNEKFNYIMNFDRKSDKNSNCEAEGDMTNKFISRVAIQLLNSALANFAKNSQWPELIKFYSEFGSVGGELDTLNEVLTKDCTNLHSGLKPKPELVGDYIKYVILALGRVNSSQLVPFISHVFNDTAIITHLINSESLYNILRIVKQISYCKTLYEFSKRMSFCNLQLNFWNFCYANLSLTGEISYARKILIDLLDNNCNVSLASLMVYINSCAEFECIDEFEEALCLLNPELKLNSKNYLVDRFTSLNSADFCMQNFNRIDSIQDPFLELKCNAPKSLSKTEERYMEDTSTRKNSDCIDRLPSPSSGDSSAKLEKDVEHKESSNASLTQNLTNNKFISSSIVFNAIEMYVNTFNFESLWALMDKLIINTSVIKKILECFKTLLTLNDFCRLEEKNKSLVSKQAILLLEKCKSVEEPLSKEFLTQTLECAATIVSYAGSMEEFNQLKMYISYWNLSLTEDFFLEYIRITFRNDPQSILLEDECYEMKNEIKLNFPSASLCFYVELLLIRFSDIQNTDLMSVKFFIEDLVDSAFESDRIMSLVSLFHYARENTIVELRSTWNSIKKKKICISVNLYIKFFECLNVIEEKEILKEILNFPVIEDSNYIIRFTRCLILCELDDLLLKTIESQKSKFSILSKNQWAILFDELSRYKRPNVTYFFNELKKQEFVLHPKIELYINN